LWAKTKMLFLTLIRENTAQIPKNFFALKNKEKGLTGFFKRVI